MRLSYTTLVTNSLSVCLGLTVGSVVGAVVGLALLPLHLLGNGVELLAGSEGVEIGTSTEEQLAEAAARFQAERDDASNTNGTAAHTPKRSRRTDESAMNGMAR